MVFNITHDEFYCGSNARGMYEISFKSHSDLKSNPGAFRQVHKAAIHINEKLSNFVLHVSNFTVLHSKVYALMDFVVFRNATLANPISIIIAFHFY